MGNETRWRVVGLWRVWDELPDAPLPTGRAPEVLLERVAGTFDHKPGEAKSDRAMIAASTAMRRAFEAREPVGRMIVDDDAWAAIQREGGWLPEGVRRHPPGGCHLHTLMSYDLDPSAAGRLWAHAGTDAAPAEDVVARLSRLGNALGLPPVGIVYGLPIFTGREARRPHQRRQAKPRSGHGRRLSAEVAYRQQRRCGCGVLAGQGGEDAAEAIAGCRKQRLKVVR